MKIEFHWFQEKSTCFDSDDAASRNEEGSLEMILA
jgi:hypothetical protein